MENIRTITEIITATAGTVISVIEFIRIRKEKLKEKRTEKTEKDLVTKVSATTLNDEFGKLYDSIDKAVKDGENWKTVSDYLIKITDSYVNYINGLEEIYKQLLKDESTFSLSYGFGRYIDALRVFTASKRTAEENMTDILDFSEVIELPDNDAKKYYFHQMSVMSQIMKRYPAMNLTEIENYYEEMQRRAHDTYSREVDEPVYALFRMFYKMLTAVDDMKKNYYDFVPYVEELKMKYPEPENKDKA